MATLDLAQDTLLGRRVALKRMSGEADVAGLTRLRREALVGASFSHINLVSVYDVLNTDDGHLVIVMEYIEGETLRDVLTRRGRLPVDEALPILGGVAAGLDAINQRGIVHRDVKPSNILLGGGGAAATVKLADLGIASAPDRTRITSSGAVLGSLSYMAPEQLSDAPVTQAIDVYALGLAVGAGALVAVLASGGSPAHPPAKAASTARSHPPSDARGGVAGLRRGRPCLGGQELLYARRRSSLRRRLGACRSGDAEPARRVPVISVRPGRRPLDHVHLRQDRQPDPVKRPRDDHDDVGANQRDSALRRHRRPRVRRAGRALAAAPDRHQLQLRAAGRLPIGGRRRTTIAAGGRR
jgi:serine/threonine protein kinase